MLKCVQWRSLKLSQTVSEKKENDFRCYFNKHRTQRTNFKQMLLSKKKNERKWLNEGTNLSVLVHPGNILTLRITHTI